VQALDNLAWRSTARTAIANPPPMASPTVSIANPLMRYTRGRTRDTAGARADWAATVSLSDWA
jgi:hypothetical protein